MLATVAATKLPIMRFCGQEGDTYFTINVKRDQAENLLRNPVHKAWHYMTYDGDNDDLDALIYWLRQWEGTGARVYSDRDDEDRPNIEVAWQLQRAATEEEQEDARRLLQLYPERLRSPVATLAQTLSYNGNSVTGRTYANVSYDEMANAAISNLAADSALLHRFGNAVPPPPAQPVAVQYDSPAELQWVSDTTGNFTVEIRNV